MVSEKVFSVLSRSQFSFAIEDAATGASTRIVLPEPTVRQFLNLYDRIYALSTWLAEHKEKAEPDLEALGFARRLADLERALHRAMLKLVPVKQRKLLDGLTPTQMNDLVYTMYAWAMEQVQSALKKTLDRIEKSKLNQEEGKEILTRLLEGWQPGLSRQLAGLCDTLSSFPSASLSH